MKILTTAQAEKIVDLAVARLANYVTDNKLKSLVNGISGGIDSAVVGAICLRTVDRLHREGYHVEPYFYFLDVHSNPFDLVKAIDFALSCDVFLEQIDLSSWYVASPLLSDITDDLDRAKIFRGNIKCRLRMIALYHFASLHRGIYVDTDDLSEDNMGFFTRHGDEGDVKIIQMLTKDEVYDLGEYLEVPKSILNSAPGDGLGVTTGNLATDQLGLPYLEIDYCLSRMLEAGFDTEGSSEQMVYQQFVLQTASIADELSVPIAKVRKVLWQALKTGFKRRYGINVANLLPSRTELGLPELGTPEFSTLYLRAIRASS